jgi:DNA-binding PadR family transcriptional regulator
MAGGGVRFAAVNRAGDMTPQMMVLGIVAERSGTVSDVQRRLSDLFSSADFPKNSAHGNLPTLAEKGHVRLVEEGADGWASDFYEITKAGVEHLREWVRSSLPHPAMREPIHAKVEFATLDELAEVIIMVRADVRTCRLTSDEAHERMLSEQRGRVAVRGERKGWALELDDELSAAHLADVTLMWDDIAERRRKLGDRLEAIHKRFKSGAG